MVGGAEFAQRGSAHQLEKVQAGLAVLFPFKVCIPLGQNGVPGRLRADEQEGEGDDATRDGHDLPERSPLRLVRVRIVALCKEP